MVMLQAYNHLKVCWEPTLSKIPLKSEEHAARVGNRASQVTAWLGLGGTNKCCSGNVTSMTCAVICRVLA